MRFALPALALFLTAAIPAAAHADTIDNFVLTGPNTLVTFSLPATPLDTLAVSLLGTDITFFLPDLYPVTINGFTTLGFFDFHTGNVPLLHGGFDIINLEDSFSLIGQVLFTGDVDNPTFRLGTFLLTDLIADPDTGRKVYKLTISQATPPITVVPEPSSGVLLLIGSSLGLFLFVNREKIAGQQSLGIVRR